MKESSVQKGNSYEEFVAEVYQIILDKQANDGQIKPIKLERLKKLKCKSCADTKVDIYWEYEIADISHKTVIECKNYKKAVGVDDVREFGNKIQDIGDVRGVLVSKNGFQDGAKKVAQHFDIELLNIRELIEDDWEGRIRQIIVQMNICSPARIIAINPIINKLWAEENGIAKDQILRLVGLNNEIFIEDRLSGYKESLYSFEQKVDTKTPGQHKWSKSFKDGWLTMPEHEYKINSVTIDYIIPEIKQETFSISNENEILAKIEKVNQNTSQVVYKDGTKKEW